LEEKIAEIKALMLAYATDGRRDDHPHIYHELFLDLDVMLEDAGYTNPNSYKTIESFWANCGSTWAARRAFISDIYADTLFDIGRRRRKLKDPRNWKAANESLEDELAPVRLQWLKAKNYIYSTPPDFENSIKESINSIESCLMILLGDPCGTLGKMIKTADIDPDIERLISIAYGTVSNKDFVRHGGVERQNLAREEAEFFLEFSAAAILYIVAKLKEAVIEP